MLQKKVKIQVSQVREPENAKVNQNDKAINLSKWKKKENRDLTYPSQHVLDDQKQNSSDEGMLPEETYNDDDLNQTLGKMGDEF